jgi:hypothetical protein
MGPECPSSHHWCNNIVNGDHYLHPLIPALTKPSRHVKLGSKLYPVVLSSPKASRQGNQIDHLHSSPSKKMKMWEKTFQITTRNSISRDCSSSSLPLLQHITSHERTPSMIRERRYGKCMISLQEEEMEFCRHALHWLYLIM